MHSLQVLQKKTVKLHDLCDSLAAIAESNLRVNGRGQTSGGNNHNKTTKDEDVTFYIMYMTVYLLFHLQLNRIQLWRMKSSPPRQNREEAKISENDAP